MITAGSRVTAPIAVPMHTRKPTISNYQDDDSMAVMVVHKRPTCRPTYMALRNAMHSRPKRCHLQKHCLDARRTGANTAACSRNWTVPVTSMPAGNHPYNKTVALAFTRFKMEALGGS